MQVGVSAGPECKAALQEVTQLVDQGLATNGEAVKRLFNAAEVCIFYFFLTSSTYKLTLVKPTI